MEKEHWTNQRAIDEMVESGTERGLQVAIYERDEQIVDAVAGVADPAAGRLFTPDTPVYCYSVCKAAASTLVHMLAQRGAFDYETRVAELWPEFGAHGKEGVTVRHVLNHTAGVPGIPLTTTIEDLCDWDKMCSAIAAAELWWEPGTKIGYHAYTFGYIVGEMIRRVTGQPISQVLHDELWSRLASKRSSTSACRGRSTTDWLCKRTRRCRPISRCRRCRQTSRCSRPRPCR